MTSCRNDLHLHLERSILICAVTAKFKLCICRYPSFIDAIRDLDDALSMVVLFSSLPQTDKIEVLL